MERIIKRLRESDIEPQRPKGREERIEQIAKFIEEADPQRSIKVVCGSEEVSETLAGIGEGFRRIKARKTGRKQGS